MWGTCSGLPSGTKSAGWKCIQSRQRPIISDDETSVNVSTRNTKTLLLSPSVAVRRGEPILSVTKVNKPKTQQWITRSTPHNMTRSAPHKKSLFNELPMFLHEDPNCVIWYQYRLPVTGNASPFYVTYPAEWCWDIEGQWLIFQEHYAINPIEAATTNSRFIIEDCDPIHPNDANHLMICDLLNMKITDQNTGHQYEFKRTNHLLGTITTFGQIAFNRYYASSEAEMFIYDRCTGYHAGCCEADFSIGDRILFDVWWNKDDTNCYHYDVRHIQMGGIHYDMVAFNIQHDDNQSTTETPKEQDKWCKTENRVKNCTVEWTTPLLNAQPIPPNTAIGRTELAKRVELKLNAMMMVAQYMLDARWKVILAMAASSLYHGQRTAWMLMRNLETDKIRENVRNRAKARSGTVLDTLDSLKVALDEHGLPIFVDKSKYKTIAITYCQKMAWKRPYESTEPTATGFTATVCFGPQGKEESACGEGQRIKNALYGAYRQLALRVIPKPNALRLMIKLVPGYKKPKADKPAKTRILEWAQQKKIAPPRSDFTELVDSSRGTREWCARVSFVGQVFESRGPRKKEAEFDCYSALVRYLKLKK
eukprot:96587_1